MKHYLAFVIFILVQGSALAATHPSGALDEINAAIDAADAGAFEAAVDLDALVGDSLTVFLREIKKPEVANGLPPLLALMFSQAAASSGENLRGLLCSEVKAFTLNGISSGAFAGRKNISKNPRGLLAPLFGDVSPGRKRVTSKGMASATENGWLMPFTLHDDGNGNDYVIKGRFRRESNGTARLVGVENIPALMEQLAGESR